MADPQEWYRMLTLSRISAAQDLRLSNEILSVVDELVNASENGSLNEQKISEISKKMITISLDLTKQSRELSVAVSKLVGVI